MLVVLNYYIADLRPGAVLMASDDIAKMEYLDPAAIKLEDCAWDGMRTILSQLIN